MFWLALLKRFWKPLVAAAVLAFYSYWFYEDGYGRGYQTRWAEDFKRDVFRDLALAKLSDDAKWSTYLANNDEVLASLQRSIVLFNAQVAAEHITDGLAQRVRDAEARLQGGAVPGSGACGSTEHPDPASATRLERLFGHEQRVQTLAGKCGAALAELASKPLCECH